MSRPRLKMGPHLARGLAGVVLFAIIALVALRTPFGDPVGFDSGTNIVAALGYSLFNIQAPGVPDGTEGFLAAFEIIDILLVAALVAAVMLARREVGGRMLGTLRGGDEE